MARPFLLLSILAIKIWTTVGSLYPIKPVSSTIYEAGLPAEVRWMEDGKSPLLNLTGKLKIALYAGRSVSMFPTTKDLSGYNITTSGLFWNPFQHFLTGLAFPNLYAYIFCDALLDIFGDDWERN